MAYGGRFYRGQMFGGRIYAPDFAPNNMEYYVENVENPYYNSPGNNSDRSDFDSASSETITLDGNNSSDTSEHSGLQYYLPGVTDGEYLDPDINFLAQRSVLEDCSDLPKDVPTLKFFYNLGVALHYSVRDGNVALLPASSLYTPRDRSSLAAASASEQDHQPTMKMYHGPHQLETTYYHGDPYNAEGVYGTNGFDRGAYGAYGFSGGARGFPPRGGRGFPRGGRGFPRGGRGFPRGGRGFPRGPRGFYRGGRGCARGGGELFRGGPGHLGGVREAPAGHDNQYRAPNSNELSREDDEWQPNVQHGESQKMLGVSKQETKKERKERIANNSREGAKAFAAVAAAAAAIASTSQDRGHDNEWQPKTEIPKKSTSGQEDVRNNKGPAGDEVAAPMEISKPTRSRRVVLARGWTRSSSSDDE